MMTDAFVPPIRPNTAFGGSDRQASRRCTLRVAGPFNGRRTAPFPTPVRLHDLSLGGCLIECDDKVTVGQRITIQIDLPTDSWITLDAEILYLRDKVGFGVNFIALSEPNRRRIDRTIERMMVERSRSVGWTFGES